MVNMLGPANLAVGAPSIDTRTLNLVMFSLRSKKARFDGHEFLQTAVNSGASAVVVSADVESVGISVIPNVFRS